MKNTVHLDLGPRSYSIVIGDKVLDRPGTVPKPASKKAPLAILLSDRNLTAQRALTRNALRKSGYDVREIPVVAGEGLKDYSKVYPLFGELLRLGAKRDSTLFVLGGGTLGDAGGFVAATYLRGISWVGLPTTLLAQVDSAIGGKTGVNHAEGKNLIGAIYQPTRVIADLRFLESLSDREMVSGLGEVVKYGFIYSPRFLAWVAANLDRLLARDSSVLERAIRESATFKARVVEVDELDRRGVREALNFGHTFGHALESVTDYKTFRHGEAVLWGMRFAIGLSAIRGHLPEKIASDLERILARFPVPALPRGLTAKRAYALMQKDKKVKDGAIRFVLLAKAGSVVLDSKVTFRDVEMALARLKKPGGRDV